MEVMMDSLAVPPVSDHASPSVPAEDASAKRQKTGESSPEEPGQAETMQIKIQYAKNSSILDRPVSSTIGELKQEIATLYDIPPPMQKLLFKGSQKTKDEDSLASAGLTNGARILLMGSKPTEILAANMKQPSTSSGLAWDAPKEKEEPWSKQTQHKKVIDKGRPEEGWPGLKDRQVPLQKGQTFVPGLLNSSGSKVRLTFKDELEQIWLGSATSTQKLPYSSIKRIDAQPIEGQEEYSILCVQLGEAGTSRYWLYYVPSQTVAAIKMKLLGVASLL